MTIEEKVLEVLKETLELDDIDNTCAQANCPVWDSMAQLNLVVDLEDVFGVRFAPKEIASMKSVGEIMRILMAKRGEAK